MRLVIKAEIKTNVRFLWIYGFTYGIMKHADVNVDYKAFKIYETGIKGAV